MKTSLSLSLALIGVITSAISAIGETRYVNVNNPMPFPPYTNWVTAVNVIQDAIDVAEAGDEIVVTNGVYQTGGREIYPGFTNRVAITKPLTVRSVNGPEVTEIRGYQVPGTTNGHGAIRCVYLTNEATLAGFTLSRGSTRDNGGSPPIPEVLCGGASGGGVFCESPSSVISNCVLIGNTALSGGGVCGGTLINCLLTANWARFQGGGACDSTLTHCTIIGNMGGGVCGGNAKNCIIYYNYYSATQDWNYGGTEIMYSCTSPTPVNGVGNITNAPLFADAGTGNFHLLSNSPCINAGRNPYATSGLDLDGNPRIVGGTVDIGAYEFQSPQSALSYAWLQQCGLPTDGSADFTDPDGDGLNNWQEWRAWTDPTNSASALRLLSPLVSTNGLLVRWRSVSGQTYSLERGTSLAAHPTFVPFASNIVGQADITIFTDTNAVGTGPLFYRVGVNE